MFDSAGPPGHTPFRSSRFVAPAKDSGELQVRRLPSVHLRPLLQEAPMLSSLWHAPFKQSLYLSLHGGSRACF